MKREAKRTRAAERQTVTARVKAREAELSAQGSSQRRRRASARDTYNAIGFDLMFENGICEVEQGMFSQTLSFSDIGYQSDTEDGQEEKANTYCKVFDGMSPNTCLQLNLINTPIPEDEIGNRVFYVTDDPRLGVYADAYNAELNDLVKEGVSNLRKERYFTYAVGAKSLDDARRALAQARGNIVKPLTLLKSKCRVLDGRERLEVVHSQTRPYKRFEFEYPDLLVSGLTAKDYVCPPGRVNWRADDNGSIFYNEADKVYGQVLAFAAKRYGSELDDQSLASLADLDIPINVSIHIQPVAKRKALDSVKRTITWIESEVISIQQDAVRSGSSIENLPVETAAIRDDAKSVYQSLRKERQMEYIVTGVVYIYARTKEELLDNATDVVSTAQNSSIELIPLDEMQLQGLNTALPLGHNHVEQSRKMRTAQLGVMVPFATEELQHPGGGFVGQHQVSKNLQFLDRRQLTSPGEIVLGMPGTGKSFWSKQDIENVALMTCDPARSEPEPDAGGNPKKPAELYVIDVKASEYSTLVRDLGGNECTLFATSREARKNGGTFINLMDLNMSGAAVAGKDPVVEQTELLSSLLLDSLESEDDKGKISLIDRAVRQVYAPFLEKGIDDVDPEAITADKMPVLEDFYDVLCEIEKTDPEAHDMRLSLERFTRGSYDYFNNRSTFSFGNRLTSFNVSKIGEAMRPWAMLTVLHLLANRMYYNYSRGVETYIWIDEAQALTVSMPVARQFEKYWSEGRQFGMFPAAMSQNPERILNHPIARYMVLNSGALVLFALSDIERKMLSELIGLSPTLEQYLETGVKPGSGLIRAGSIIVPFEGNTPKNSPNYALRNTKADEMAAEKRAAILAAQNEPSGKAGGTRR